MSYWKAYYKITGRISYSEWEDIFNSEEDAMLAANALSNIPGVIDTYIKEME